MRKLINVFKDNILFFIEIIILVVAFMIPKIIDANNLFSKFISTNDPTPENVWYYLIIQRSNVIIGIGLCLVAWYKIRKYNKDNEVTMNRDISIYHQHFFFWYWFVSKVMGVKKCKLIKVIKANGGDCDWRWWARIEKSLVTIIKIVEGVIFKTKISRKPKYHAEVGR